MTFTSPPTQQLDRPKGLGYGARLGNLWVRLAVGPGVELRIYDQDSLADRQAQTSNPLENVLELGYLFARSDLSGGEGLDFFPRVSPRLRTDRDTTRFFDSANLDMRRPERGRPYRVRLSNSFDEWYTAPEGEIVAVRSSRRAVWFAAGDTVASFLDLDDTLTDSSHAFAADIAQMDVSPNDEGVVLLVTGALHYKAIGSDVWTVVPNVGGALDNVVGVWFAKDRIIAAVADPGDATATTLIEVGIGITGDPDAPTLNPVVVEFDSFYAQVHWVVDAGLAILASTDDGYIRSYVPQTDSAGSAPVLTVRAKTPMPRGESAISMIENSSTVLLLTTSRGEDGNETMRVYSALMRDAQFDFILSDLALLREWSDVATEFLHLVSMATNRDNIYWMVPEDVDVCHMWRYDVATGGVFRHSFTTADHAHHITTFQNTELFSALDTLFRRSDRYHTQGYLITPAINFDLNTDINWLSAVLQIGDVIPGQGTQAELFVTDSLAALSDPESTEWHRIARYSNPGSVGQEITLSGRTSKHLAAMIRLYANQSLMGTPFFDKVGLRGFPRHRDWVVELPVAISDQVEVPGRRPIRIAGWGDQIYTSVSQLQGAQVDALVLDPPIRVRGVVNRVFAPVTYITDRGSAGRMFTVQVIGNKVPLEGSASAPTGDTIVGRGLLGSGIIGVGVRPPSTL